MVAESSFATFRQIAYIRVGQVFHAGSWLRRTVLRPAVELAFVYGRLTRGVNLAAASPEESVAGSRVPVPLIHGLADSKTSRPNYCHFPPPPYVGNGWYLDLVGGAATTRRPRC